MLVESGCIRLHIVQLDQCSMPRRRWAGKNLKGDWSFLANGCRDMHQYIPRVLHLSKCLSNRNLRTVRFEQRLDEGHIPAHVDWFAKVFLRIHLLTQALSLDSVCEPYDLQFYTFLRAALFHRLDVAAFCREDLQIASLIIIDQGEPAVQTSYRKYLVYLWRTSFEVWQGPGHSDCTGRYGATRRLLGGRSGWRSQFRGRAVRFSDGLFFGQNDGLDGVVRWE